MWIKLYGERNTNTNYLSKLIELNLDAPQLRGVVPRFVLRLQERLPGDERIRDWYFAATFGRNLGWKHMCVKSVDELRRYRFVRNGDVGFVTITKNPYSWLLSLHRRPYSLQVDPDISFDDFVSMSWQTIGRGNLNRRVLKSPMELWNLKNASYLALAKALPCVRLTTESIFVEPEAAIDRIAGEFRIPKRSEQFVNFERSTKDWSKDTDYYRDYYVNEKWRDKLSPQAIEKINSLVDRELMREYGYKLIE